MKIQTGDSEGVNAALDIAGSGVIPELQSASLRVETRRGMSIDQDDQRETDSFERRIKRPIPSPDAARIRPVTVNIEP